MLEIQIPDMVAKPLRQVALANVADLFALAERDDLSPVLRTKLKGYPERIRRALEDLPNGGEFEDFILDLESIPAWRIPVTLREALELIAKQPKRTSVEADRLNGVLDLIDQEVARAFEMGARAKPKVEKGAVAGAPRSPAGGSTRSRAAAGTKRSSTKSSSGGSKKSTRKVVEVDPARAAWLRQTLLDRVQRAGNSLQEVVLIAGIRHRGREVYPDLQALEIRNMLKKLGEEGLVRHSAGRWSSPNRY